MRKGELEAEEVTRFGRESERKEKTNSSAQMERQKEVFIVIWCENWDKHQSFLHNLADG